MTPRSLARVLLFALLLGYWALALRHLTVLPAVYEDEPWQASTGWKLAQQGVFGSDLFAGYYHMDRRYYGYMPLHPLALAVIFRLAGLGLFQARLEPVIAGLLVLALTAALARRLFRDERIAPPALGLLLLVRTSGLTASLTTGIVFADVARIARYDMLVPVFGLLALHAYLRARAAPAERALRWYGVAGLLAGLAGLAHLYGLFWIPALALLVVWDGAPRGRLAALAALAAGAVLPWLPYALYVLGDLPDWRGQTRGYGPRFELLNPGWYLDNVLAEHWRYGPGLGSFGPGWLARPGFWSALVALPLALAALLRAGRRDPAARALCVPAVVLPGLFALLLYLKLPNYLVAVLPLFALAVAWGGVRLWDAPGGATAASRRRTLRAALVLVLAAVCAEGAWRLAARDALAARTTPYPVLAARLHALIPPGTRVLGLHNYWLGLEDHDYRTWLVPVFLADARVEPAPLALDAALDGVAPDVVLLDPRMRAYFDAERLKGGEPARRYDGWLARRHGEVIARLDDPVYGLFEIIRVTP